MDQKKELKLSLSVCFTLCPVQFSGLVHVVPPVSAGWSGLDRPKGKCEREMEEGRGGK